jgi:hypothetical protein
MCVHTATSDRLKRATPSSYAPDPFVTNNAPSVQPAAVRAVESQGYCPNHATGVKLPDDFVVTPLQYVD